MPLLVVVLLTPFSENWFGVPRHILGVVMFLGAALTDYFDGRLARSRGQVTRLGQLLDPIADKLLISAALISLVENQLAARMGGRDHHRTRVCGYRIAIDRGGRGSCDLGVEDGQVQNAGPGGYGCFVDCFECWRPAAGSKLRQAISDDRVLVGAAGADGLATPRGRWTNNRQ